MCDVFYMYMFCLEIKTFPLNLPSERDASATFVMHLNLRPPWYDITVEDGSIIQTCLVKCETRLYFNIPYLLRARHRHICVVCIAADFFSPHLYPETALCSLLWILTKPQQTKRNNRSCTERESNMLLDRLNWWQQKLQFHWVHGWECNKARYKTGSFYPCWRSSCLWAVQRREAASPWINRQFYHWLWPSHLTVEDGADGPGRDGFRSVLVQWLLHHHMHNIYIVNDGYS